MSEPEPVETPGGSYLRLCQSVNQRFGGSKESARAKASERERTIRQLQVEVSKRTKALDSISPSDDAGSKRHSKVRTELQVKEKELARLVRIQEQKDFKRAMRITGMGLEVNEVVCFATVCALLAFTASLFIIIFLGFLLHLSPFIFVVVAMVCLLAAPLTVFLFIAGYPERLAKNQEMEAFGSAPEIINYMVMSMELSPSLDRALQFAAENAEGPMARELKALMWKVQTREFPSTEDALVAYARELEGMNEELRSALYNILSAAKESGQESMRSSLTRASDIVLTGTRQRVESFAASLGTPATILFALGILLPMIIGSLLPMMTIGGLDMDLASAQPTSSDQTSWTGGFILSVLLMDVVFPVIAFGYARSILARRPGVHTVSQGERREKRSRRASVSLLVIVTFTAFSYLTLTYLTFWGIESSLAALSFLLGTGLGIGYYLYGSREGSVLSVESLEKLEDQMPDMLFQLGSRLSEGQALERAMEDVARSMDGTEMGDFLARAVGRMKRSGQALSVAILSPDEGILASYPSRKLFATMKLVIDSAEKDPQAAGRTIITMSNHMRDLANTDREMRLRLRSTVDSMRSTALLFAPVIMGVTIGLYSLLGRTFGDVSGGDIIPVPLFIMLIGVYLMFSVATMIYFCTGIERGRSRTEMSRQVGMAIPLATTIFCAIALGALMMFG